MNCGLVVYYSLILNCLVLVLCLFTSDKGVEDKRASSGWRQGYVSFLSASSFFPTCKFPDLTPTVLLYLRYFIEIPHATEPTTFASLLSTVSLMYVFRQ